MQEISASRTFSDAGTVDEKQKPVIRAHFHGEVFRLALQPDDFAEMENAGFSQGSGRMRYPHSGPMRTLL
jgi:hypothetical protein